MCFQPCPVDLLVHTHTCRSNCFPALPWYVREPRACALVSFLLLRHLIGSGLAPCPSLLTYLLMLPFKILLPARFLATLSLTASPQAKQVPCLVLTVEITSTPMSVA